MDPSTPKRVHADHVCKCGYVVRAYVTDMIWNICVCICVCFCLFVGVFFLLVLLCWTNCHHWPFTQVNNGTWFNISVSTSWITTTYLVYFTTLFSCQNYHQHITILFETISTISRKWWESEFKHERKCLISPFRRQMYLGELNQWLHFKGLYIFK